MRSKAVVGLFSLVGALSAAPLSGQDGVSHPPPRRIGPPYTAEFKISETKVQPDGSVQTHESQETVAVDLAGRKLTATTSAPEDNDQAAVTKSTVVDPAARTTTKWSSQVPLVTVIRQPDEVPPEQSCWIPVEQAAPQATEPEPERGPGPAVHIVPPPTQLSAAPVPAPTKAVKISTEDLGIATIGGMQAHGTRLIETTLTGADPAVSTKETWIVSAHGIGLVAREIDDDSQGGKLIRELVSLTYGEPDTRLLQPPAEYRQSIQEMRQVACAERR